MRWFLVSVLLVLGTRVLAHDDAAPSRLAGTAPLEIEKPLDEQMLDGLHRYCLRQLAESPTKRHGKWARDVASIEAHNSSVAEQRKRFQALIGAIDHRTTAAGQGRFELLASLDQSSILARRNQVVVHQVRWPVIEGVTAEGLLLVPETIRAGVIALPDADWTPELFCGLHFHEELQPSVLFAGRLAASGCLVVIPTLINRSDEYSGHPDVAYTNQPHREFLYRQAFEVGRHVIGYEVQKVLAAVDLMERYFDARNSDRTNAAIPIGVAGVGEGGLLALYASALDPRLKATLVSGYFQEREAVWQEPIYRNVWALLNEFGDAELAGLIAPRRLVIEASAAVEIAGPPAARAGRRNVAAPGRIANPSLGSVQREFARAAAIYRSLNKESEVSLVIRGEAGHGSAGSEAAIRQFATALGIEPVPAEQLKFWQLEPIAPQEPAAWLLRDRSRQKRQLDELQQHVQKLLHRSPAIRDKRWSRDALTVDPRDPARAVLRRWVREELIGCLPAPQGDFHARSRLLHDNARYSTYEILLDVVDEITASGILLVPKNLAADEKRPVVVCQHGLESRAIDTLSREPEAFKYYKAFAEELVQRGFIVYAPQNPYRGGDRFRTLQRMSNPLRRSLFSYIIAQHEQTLRWLATQPFVDADRIAFYGLSYGGKTAMRVPPLVDGYSLSICSGDFTDWARTIASNDQRFSYLFTSEYEIPEWNMAHVAGYAELAMLMAPRPFMVEAGHRDGGQPSDWVAGEFGKVRRHYDQLGIAERAELEFFDGPHTIHGQGTFAFLHKHLHWLHRNSTSK